MEVLKLITTHLKYKCRTVIVEMYYNTAYYIILIQYFLRIQYSQYLGKIILKCLPLSLYWCCIIGSLDVISNRKPNETFVYINVRENRRW